MRISLSLAVSIGLLASSAPVFAQTPTDVPSVTIEQVSAGSLGSWTFLYDGGSITDQGTNVNRKKHTFYPKSESVTLMVMPPAGSESKIVVSKNGEVLSSAVTRQATVNLDEIASYRFMVSYAFNQNGTIGVTSTPSGLQYKMTGPDGKLYRGMTPKVYENIPTGTYTILVQKSDCTRPRPQNKKLKTGERIVIHLEIDCDAGLRTGESKPVPSRRTFINGVRSREVQRATRIRSTTTP